MESTRLPLIFELSVSGLAEPNSPELRDLELNLRLLRSSSGSSEVVATIIVTADEPLLTAFGSIVRGIVMLSVDPIQDSGHGIVYHLRPPSGTILEIPGLARIKLNHGVLAGDLRNGILTLVSLKR